MNSSLNKTRTLFKASPALPGHELPYQLFLVCVADMSGLAFKRVANAHRNRYARVFTREQCSDLVFLRFVLVRFEITKDCVRVGSCLLFW